MYDVAMFVKPKREDWDNGCGQTERSDVDALRYERTRSPAGDAVRAHLRMGHTEVFRDGAEGKPYGEVVVAAPTKETEMEANRKQECEFTVEHAGEQWDITQAWIAPGGKVAWYDGNTVRDGVTFFRTFWADEITVPQVEHA